MAYSSDIMWLVESRSEELGLPGMFGRIMSGSYTESDRENFETITGFLQDRGFGREMGVMTYVCREVLSWDEKIHLAAESNKKFTP